jgi:hypothetical protein
LDDNFVTFISMKVKLSPASFLCFFCLVFLIHEIHDWAHFWASTAVCGCLGNRAFDSWSACTTCDLGHTYEQAFAWLAGPLVNYLAIWVGWGLMQPDNPPEKQSLGFSMVFAALPFPRIMAALAGGGDETAGLRQLFQRPDGSNHYIVAGAGLLVVVLLCAPALVRAFILVTGWVGRAIVFPAFFVLPSMVDRWLVHGELNRLLVSGVLSRQILRGGTQLFVFVWAAVLLMVFLLCRKSLEYVLEYKELNV